MKPTDHCDLLKCIVEQETKAREFGFYWEHIDQLLEQIRSECLEVKEAWEHNDQPHLQEEIGDLLQAAVSLALFCKIDPHETLLKSVIKFQKRYDTLVELAHQEGSTHLRNQPIEVLMDYWVRAKEHIKTTQE